LTLVLASASPQRRAILEQLGIAFDVRPSHVEEADEGLPAAVAQENALRKALAVPGEGRLVLGVDTLVATELEIWGKPPNAEAARETLRRLQGRAHEVHSGFALVRDGVVEVAGVARTTVTFRELDEAQIAAYVALGEWDGRAGGYAIQGRGAALVRAIDGCYLNVVGLPVQALLDAAPDLLAAAFAAGSAEQPA
jgi:septum formation protein